MTLAIDWGNSRLKAGWFEGHTLVKTARYVSAADLATALTETPASRVIVSSTSHTDPVLREELNALPNGSNWLIFNASIPVPLLNNYETPHTLGADRLAAAVGAAGFFPGLPCLIFDLGTCLTADFVAATGTFMGGLISPGLQMRLRAMHTFTARLPLPHPLPGADNWPPLTARNTHEALLSGAMNGMALELAGIRDAYANRYPGLRVIVCGGDGPLFLNRLKPGIFAMPELVLHGLNRILLAQVPA